MKWLWRHRAVWVSAAFIVSSVAGILAFSLVRGDEGKTRPSRSWVDDVVRRLPPRGVDPLARSVHLFRAVSRVHPPEFLEYLYWEATGQGTGWFHPGETRYGWEWLAARHGLRTDQSIPRSAFRGPPEFFERLDRNRDGVLSAADFDWPVDMTAIPPATASGSPARAAPPRGDPPGAERRGTDTAVGTPALPERPGGGGDREMMMRRMQQVMANYLVRLADTDGDGRISREEWLAFFDRAAQGKDHLTPEDIRDAVTRLQARTQPRRLSVRVQGLFKGETGSFFEGPAIGQPAPDFSLKTPDGRQEIRLSTYRARRPVVLIFGSFT